ncbi:transcriptional regulator [Demequina rhizosphaerae]|uniref:transcriptional regulator n=1 Tax=Demequina rhizosphaerae TaxID=1638985 RepID=UPI00078242A9|nr:transcriptional regulator [Demequina rhizosphaerae]
MPKLNQARSIQAERTLALRVAYEREKRGWTYESLAKRMTDKGCAINASAIYKIEKAEPPRRIVVDELVGFASAFAVPVQEMLMPPMLAGARDLYRLISDYAEAVDELASARALAADRAQLARDYAREHTNEESLAAAIDAWVETEGALVVIDDWEVERARWREFLTDPAAASPYDLIESADE